MQYSLAWLIQETLSAIQSAEYQGRASVPINQTGEYERHTDGDILEFVSLQADALNAPPCDGADSQTIKSISYLNLRGLQATLYMVYFKGVILR